MMTVSRQLATNANNPKYNVLLEHPLLSFLRIYFTPQITSPAFDLQIFKNTFKNKPVLSQKKNSSIVFLFFLEFRALQLLLNPLLRYRSLSIFSQIVYTERKIGYGKISARDFRKEKHSVSRTNNEYRYFFLTYKIINLTML